MDSSQQAAVAEAVRCARFNEAVIVTIGQEEEEEKINEESDDDNPSTTAKIASSCEMVLVAALDAENGGVSWVQEHPIGTDRRSEDHGILRHLRTKRWVLPMLNDHHRNQLYEEAIQRACEKAVASIVMDGDQSPQLRILDIGSGTGLLAMMAARHGVKEIQNIYTGTETITLKEENNNSSSCGMADKSTDKSVHITSLEMAPAMARLARKTIASNQKFLPPQASIKVAEGHSCHPNILPTNDKHTFDICISELLETGLLGEGILPALRDAWERYIIKPSSTSQRHGIMVPQKARVFGQLVEGRRWINGYRGPDPYLFGPQTQSGDNDNQCFFSLALSSNPKDVLLGGTNVETGARVPVHAKMLLSDDSNTSQCLKSIASCEEVPRDESTVVLALSDPVPVLDIDFSSRESIPSPQGQTQVTSVTPTQSGTVHGILYSWELTLWDDIVYSTVLGSENEGLWQDHWHQCLYVFGADHEDCPKVIKGKIVDLVAFHDDTSISFTMSDNKSTKSQDSASKRPKIDDTMKLSNLKAAPDYKTTSDSQSSNSLIPINSTIKNQYISPERALQLNDADRMNTMIKAIQTALRIKQRGASILDVSDFSLCAIVAATVGSAICVTSLESSTLGSLPMISARVAQLGNCLPRTTVTADKGEAQEHQFQVVHAHAENITADVVYGGKVDIVMSEPYYEILEGWHLPEALNYYHLVRSLRRRDLLSNNCLSVPKYASVMCCAIQSICLAKAYGPVGDESDGNDKNNNCQKDIVESSYSRNSLVRGFCHKIVNEHGNRYSTYDLCLPLWQYDYTLLTNAMELAKIPYEGSSMAIEGHGKWKNTSFCRPGVCHGMICWVEYGYRVHEGADPNSVEKISTNSRCHRQIVRLFAEPTNIQEEDMRTTRFACRVFLSELDGCEDHDFEFKLESASNN